MRQFCLPLALLCVLCGVARAQSESEWLRPSRVLLGVTQPRLAFSAAWDFTRADNGDVRIAKEENRPGRAEKGEVIILGSHGFATRDLMPAQGEELVAIDAPVVMLQVLLRLLDRGFPKGPGTVGKEQKIEFRESTRSIVVSGVGAGGEFLAPWSVRGTVGRIAEKQIRFELEFTSANRSLPSKPYVTAMSGAWVLQPAPPMFSEKLSLEGWRVYRIGQRLRPHGSINALETAAMLQPSMRSLGELRRAVEQWTVQSQLKQRFQCS